MVKVKPCAKVITIEPARNTLTIAWVVELFSASFGQICALKEVDKLVLSSLTQELTTAVEAEAVSKAVLFDHDGQFKEQWKKWCRV
jgi:hypothetical protein